MLSRRGFAFGLLSLGVAGSSRWLAGAEAPAPDIEVTKTHIDFKLGKTLLARYIIDPKAAKPYFWPLNVAGTPVTRGWPMDKGEGEAKDHPHQKSAWFCHGDVIPQGIPFKKHIRGVTGVDFWSEAKGHGNIVCVSVGKPQVTRTSVSVKTANEWRTAEGDPILDETRILTFTPMGVDRYLIALDIDLHAKYCPIVFGDTKEGALGVRVRESVRVDRGKGELTNAEGKSGEGKKANNVDRAGCWGLVSAWCDYSGPVDDKGTVAGLAIFADPKNPIDTAWHARDYGLLAANPFGRAKHAKFPDRKGNNDLVTIKKGEHLKLRYGLYLHAGNGGAGKVAEAFKQFSAASAKKEK